MNEHSRSSGDSLLYRVRDLARVPGWRTYADLSGDAAALAAFAAQAGVRCRRGVATFCIVVAAMMAANVGVWTAVQGYWGPLVFIRLAAIGILGLIVGLLLTRFGRQRSRELGLVAVVVTAVLMEALALYTGGPQSVQHDRLSVVILGTAFVIAWGARWAAATVLLVSGVFVINALVTDAPRTVATALQLAYLGTSGVLAVVVATVRDMLRWDEFCRDRSLGEAQRRVAESERRYHSLFETAGGATVVLDLNSRIREFNREAERITGWKRHEVLGRCYLETFVAERHRPAVRAVIDRVTAGESSTNLEGSILRRDGSTAVLLWNNAPINDADGERAGLIGIGIDVTMRREAERRVRASEERFRTIFENAPVMIDGFDRDGRCVLWNRECERTLGWTREEILAAEDPLAMVYPDAAGRERVLASIMRADGTFREYEVRTKSGAVRSQRWADFRLPGGSLISVAYDVTERNRTERALRDHEEHLRRLLESTNAISWEVDPIARTLRYVSPQSEDILGYPAVQWTRDLWIERLHPDDRTCTLSRLAEAVARAEDLEHEYRMVAADGRTVWLHDRVSVESVGGVARALRGVMIDVTARKRAEQRQRESEERLRLLVETTNAVPWEADATTWRFSYVGPQAERVLGYDLERWFEHEFWVEHIHPDDRALTIDYRRKASRHCEDYEFEYRMIAADGRVVWLHDLVTVEFRDGAPVTLRGFMIDITQRKRSDEALRLAREQYETLYETAPDMLLSVDLDTASIIQCNQAVVTATGWTKDELIGQPVFVLHPPEGRASQHDLFRRVQRDGEARNVGLELVRKDGSRLDVSLNVNTERDAAGRLHARGVMRDVTDLKRMQGALARSEARYRAIVEDQTEFICRTRPDLTISFVNEAFCRHLGLAREELVGSSVLRVVDAEPGQAARDALARLGPDNPVSHHVDQVIGPDGKRRWRAWTNRAILDDAGSVREYQSVGRDVTARKLAEEALRNSEARYRQLVDSSQGFICSHDMEGTVLSANPAGARALGFDDPEELVGMNVRGALAPSVRAGFDTYLEEIRRDRKHSGLLRIRTPSGEERTWVYRNVLCEEEGRAPYVIGHAQDITELERAEGALRESERRYRAVVEDQTELICRYGRDGRLTFVNPAYCRYYGQRREDIVGTEWRPAIDPEDLGWMYTTIASLGPDRPTCTMEHRVTAPDGDPRWQLWTNRAIIDERGQVVGYQCVGRDITDRKRAEEKVERLNLQLEERVRERTEQLRASEELLRSMFQKAPLGMALAGKDGGFIDTNPAFESLLGRTHEDLQKLHIPDVTHPDDLDATRRGLLALLEGRKDLVAFEKRYVRPDGRTPWADTVVTVIHDSAGEFRYGLAMIQEATARKIEEALHAGEKRALELLEQNASLEEALTGMVERLGEIDRDMACAVLMVDADGRRLRHGAALGMPEAYHEHVDDLEIGLQSGSCGAAALRRERVIIEDTATDPLWADYREQINRMGLRACWAEPIAAAGGALLGVFGVFYRHPRRPTLDEIGLLEHGAAVAGIIIERKRAAELLKRHQIELAHVGRVSLVGELASGLAHELHQPLAAITNYAGACVRRVDNGDIDRADQLMYPIEQMRMLALRAGEIVRGLRTLIQNGDPCHERVDLNELIKTATHLAQPEARQRGITLRLDMASMLPAVEVYAIQIEQVILNLVNNGIEAMSADGRSSDELIVRSYVEAGRDDGVMIAVCDGGHGLPDDPEKVFEPFFTTKRNGLGMGLAISRSIVETQGGRLWAESNGEGGSTFFVRLPAASARPTRLAGNGASRHARIAS